MSLNYNELFDDVEVGQLALLEEMDNSGKEMPARAVLANVATNHRCRAFQGQCDQCEKFADHPANACMEECSEALAELDSLEHNFEKFCDDHGC